MADRETSAEIEIAAALWAVRVDGEEAGSTLEGELQAWLGADMRRLGAYVRARATLLQAKRVKALGPDFDPELYSLEHGEADDAAPPPAHDPVVLPTRRRILIGGSLAVAVAAATAVGLSWPAAATTYSTRRGEVRLIPLADGSAMTLNTQSTARVLFTSRERHIELVEGEALFDVAPDTKRPFLVEAGGSLVKAATTSFTISHLPDQAVRVTVRQGSVQIAGRNASQPATQIAANTRAIMADGAGKTDTFTIAPSEMKRDLAWQQGMLSFEDTPLDEAARQFARYSDTAIRFERPDIGQETITGLYAANNPQGFARSAALSLGLRASERPGTITLGR